MNWSLHPFLDKFPVMAFFFLSQSRPIPQFWPSAQCRRHGPFWTPAESSHTIGGLNGRIKGGRPAGAHRGWWAPCGVNCPPLPSLVSARSPGSCIPGDLSNGSNSSKGKYRLLSPATAFRAIWRHLCTPVCFCQQPTTAPIGIWDGWDSKQQTGGMGRG